MRKGVLVFSSIGLVLFLGMVTLGSSASAVDNRPVTRQELLSLLHGIRLTEGVLYGMSFAPDNPRDVRPDPVEAMIASSSFRDLYLRNMRNLQSWPTSEGLANAALIEAIEGDLDSSVDLLERAVQLGSSNDPTLWNDLAVMYLQRAREHQQPYDLVLALDAAEKASNGGFWEARFNRALILTLLHLDPAARGAWKEIMGDATLSPEWSEEARMVWWSLRRTLDVPLLEPPALLSSFEQKGVRVIEEFVQNNPQRARSYGEDILLGKWAELHEGTPKKAELILALTEAIGVELHAAHGDRLLLDSVRAIQAKEGGISRLQLVVGHNTYALGYSAFKRGDCQSAQALLLSSERALKRGGSPFARWAGFYQAICSYFAQDYANAEAKVLELESSEMGHYITLEARLRWLQGLLRISQANSAGSLDAYLRSLLLFEKANEDGNVAAVSSLVAENLLRLGKKEEAWRYRERALAILREKGSTRFQAILDEASEAAFRDGHYRMAGYLQDEVVRIVNGNGTAHEAAEAHLRRISIDIRLGQVETAEEDFKATLHFARKISDVALQERLKADALLAIGESRLALNPVQALADFDRVLSLYTSFGYRFKFSELRHLRALAREALGDDRLAEAELEAGIREVEGEIEILQGELRETYVLQAIPLFDERVRLAAQGADGAFRALLYSERARTMLLSVISGRQPPSVDDLVLKIGQIQKGMPAEAAVVMFCVLDRKTLVWLLDDEGIRLQVVDAGKEEIRSNVDLLNASASGAEKFKRQSSLLFDRLVRPVIHEAYKQIVFVPDKYLWNVPFSALYDNRAKHYLVESTSVVVAPCLSGLSFSVKDKITPRSSVLAIGDPASSLPATLALTRLPSALREAQLVSALYPGQESQLLLGKEATVEAFMVSAPLREVLHFSGHVIEVGDYPVLLFAPDAAHPSGMLTAREISRIELSRNSVVMIAACRASRQYSQEGFASLNYAFLAAGASEVVGSLWKVGDRAGEVFFGEVHQRLAAGMSGVESVQEAQRWMLGTKSESRRFPLAWAGFQVVSSKIFI